MPSLLPLKYKYLERLYDTHSFTFGKFTITPICTGFISTRHHRNWEEPEAVFIWLLQSDSDSILIDTGLSDKVNGTQYFPAFLNFYFRNKYKFYLPPHRLENDPYQKVFSNTASINTVLLTHAHFDHTGMLANFVKSNIVVSQKEFKAASGKLNFFNGYTPGTLPALLHYFKFTQETNSDNKIVLDKKFEVFPGLYVVPTYRHTKGHLAFILRQNNQYICFAGDEGENIVHSGKLDNIEKEIIDFAAHNHTLILNNHDNNAIRKLCDWVSMHQ